MDVLTAAARINRNIKKLPLEDQKAVIDFVQKSIEQRLVDQMNHRTHEIVGDGAAQ